MICNTLEFSGNLKARFCLGCCGEYIFGKRISCAAGESSKYAQAKRLELFLIKIEYFGVCHVHFCIRIEVLPSLNELLHSLQIVLVLKLLQKAQDIIFKILFSKLL